MGLGKNALLILKKAQDYANHSVIDKIYLYAKDPIEAKYQQFINKLENCGLKRLKDPEIVIEYSNNMQDVYENIEGYSPDQKCNVLIVFDDIIANMICNKNFYQIVTELLIRERKLNIPTFFIT